MTSYEKRAPEVRFRGYSDEWEQRKLGDLSESFEYGLNVAATKFDGVNKYIRITDIDDESRKFLETDLTSPNIELSNAGKYKLKYGDILFARTGASVGKTYIYNVSDGIVYYAGFLIRARIKPEYDSEFVFQNTLSNRYKKYIGITSQRSGQPGVNAQEYAEYKINVPKYDEQVKIGAFLRGIDTLIALHQRKLNKLIQLKKGYMQVMFPQKGENVPRLRFADFDDIWEQRKLGEVAEIIGGGTPSTSIREYWDGDIEWYSPVEIGKEIYAFNSQRKITELGLKKSSAKVLPANKTILFTSRAGIGDMAILKKDGATNQGFQSLVVNDNYDIYFIYSMGNKIKEFALKHASGSTFLEISKQELDKMELLAPSFQEQINIGKFFTLFDETITSHQKKLNKLQSLKKAYLQKMFI